ncbi:MAG: hypothetical protein JXC85_03700 [Candidatus Aenigmarchaeota archaeon]|nr:hypothetical protein [Candidatus Aenigmarchaeota archaeon]
MSKSIKFAVSGVGNCLSSLIQGIHYYKDIESGDVPGLMHVNFGGYLIKQLKPVAAFDVDKRKVGKDLGEAIFAKPNCTTVFHKDVPKLGVEVKKGPVLDGVASHMHEHPEDRTFVLSDESPVDAAKELRDSGAEILINYMPVGSEHATSYYAQAALDAGCAFVNCMPVFIASTPHWVKRFEDKRLPIIGDDIKSQVGATIVHRTLAKLFSDRGVKIVSSYQLNVGGNSVTGDQEIMLAVNGKVKKTRIGDFIDRFVDVFGEKRADGKDVVIVEDTEQEIKCFTVDDDFNVIQSDVGALIRHRISEPIYEITTEEGRKIKITKDHNVFTLDDEGNLEEIPIGSVRENDTFIAVPRSLEFCAKEEAKVIDLNPYLDDMFVKGVSDGFMRIHNHPEIRIPVHLPVTDELLQIVGLWLADGNYDRLSSSNIELACGNEPECMAIVDSFTCNYNLNYNVRSDGVRVRLLSKTLSKIFRLALGLGGNAYSKRVPGWVFGLSERQIGLVLRGYLSGDGGVTGKQIRWSSASEGLVSDIQTLFLRIGINSTVFKETYGSSKSSYSSSLGHIWHGLISSDDMGPFMAKAGFLQDYKNEMASEALGKLRMNNTHKIPNISLFKRSRIKSKTWHKHKSIRAYIVLNQLDKIKDEFERERARSICSGDVRFLKIRKVKQIRTDGVYVYDISTKPYERFICSNILVHNTDFSNMLARDRLKSKKISKTQAVQSNLPVPINPYNLHISPSDYVPWLKDKKLCFLRIEGRKFGDVPINIEARLEVEDSPNSAGVVIDALRAAKIGLDRGLGGPLDSISAYCMKSPPHQYPDPIARDMVEEFIRGDRER